MARPYLGNPKYTIEVLQKYHFVFQKRFGQNFLIDTHVLDKIIDSAQITKDDFVLEIGPGIGTSPVTAEGIRQLLSVWQGKIVLDADALNLLASNPGLLELLPEGAVLTPHPKEFERLAGKISYGSANARDLLSLKNSAKQLPDVKKTLSQAKSPLLTQLYDNLDTLEDVYQIIEDSIIEDPPISVKEGGIIKLGYDEEIDHLKKATTEGKSWVLEIEAKERETTGIKGLKVGFNKVFGYFIEVTKSNLSMVPDRFIRKQTLANCERYITEELKKVENEIVTGEKGIRHEKFLACISSNERTPRHIIRKAARLASRYNTVFFALYVQTPAESTERIPLATQRHLLNHFKLVTELGGEVIQVSSSDIMGEIIKTCRQRGITTVCMGHPAFKMPGALFSLSKYRKFLNSLAEIDIDLIILA